MEEFFSDPWVTGIGGGLISGIIVYFLTTFIAEKRQNKEYKQKVSAANRDVVYLIRTCIPEKITPDIALVDMLIDSVSRKYSVRRNDMLTVKQIYSDISMEIMDSYFISAEKKIELCQMITNSVACENNFQGADSVNMLKDEIKNSTRKHDDIRLLSFFMSLIIFTLFILVTFKSQILSILFNPSTYVFIISLLFSSLLIIVIDYTMRFFKKNK